MALILADRVKVRSRSTGLGDFTLENVVPGFQSFAAIGDGNETYYGITDLVGNWEIGRGTYTASGSILSRDDVISSSNAGSKVNFATGSKNVFCTFPSSALETVATGGSSDRLIEGSNQVILEADGSITFPTKTFKNWNDSNETGPTLQLGNDPTSQVLITGPTPTNDDPNAQRLVIQGQQGYGGEGNNKGEGGDVYIWAGSGGDGGSIDPRGDGGDVKLRGGKGGNEGGYIRIESGDAQAEGGTGGFLELTAGDAGSANGTGGQVTIRAGYGANTGGNVEINAGAGGTTTGNVEIYAGNSGAAFKSNGSFSLNYGEVHIATNNWGRTIGGGTGATGVVYTAINPDLASIRAHITIEGYQDGDTTGNHSQACDMMIVRRVANGGAVTVDAMVYGIVYTSTGPLATLNAQWNSGSSRIEITATPTSSTNNVFVKVYATEVARGD
jgi:hypothetical protein